MIIFLKSDPHHRDLHSFPTRRSSDLSADHPVARFQHTKDMIPLDLGETIHRDRKSTRLNSSHVAISYAVFCLKKKNKIRHALPLFQLFHGIDSLDLARDIDRAAEEAG